MIYVRLHAPQNFTALTVDDRAIKVERKKAMHWYPDDVSYWERFGDRHLKSHCVLFIAIVSWILEKYLVCRETHRLE